MNNSEKFNLNDLLNLTAEIKRINLRIKSLRSRLESLQGLDYSKPRVQGTSGGIGALEAVIDLIEEQKRALFSRLYEITTLELEFYRRLDRLPLEAHRRVLELRYVNGLKGVKLSMAMNYSERGVYKLLQTAKSEFYRLGGTI